MADEHISEGYEKALELFRSLSALLINNTTLLNAHHILDAYGRLRIWAARTGADKPWSTRGSLDQLLRSDKELCATILKVFQLIQNTLEHGQTYSCNLLSIMS